jgi:hypothetical protein
MFMSQSQMERQYGAYSQLGGAVFRDTSFGFMPAFKNLYNDETHLCTYDSGELAVVHVLDGLPSYWVEEWGADGRPHHLKKGIIAGFMRFGRFYTLNEITHELRDS